MCQYRLIDRADRCTGRVSSTWLVGLQACEIFDNTAWLNYLTFSIVRNVEFLSCSQHIFACYVKDLGIFLLNVTSVFNFL